MGIIIQNLKVVYRWSKTILRWFSKGMEGNDGVIGAEPTSRKYEPVTSISWFEIIVWTNALSEIMGYEPVYRYSGGEIIKDSYNLRLTTDYFYSDVVVQTDNDGYRLPTGLELEMAARWRNYSGDGSIIVDGRYWTPGSYASGATNDFSDLGVTNEVAWYLNNSNNKTQPVGTKKANHLGIYDMSGNVSELCFDRHPDYLWYHSVSSFT